MASRVNKVKQVSSLRRWEHWCQVGIPVPTGVGGQLDILRGRDLEGYTDEAIWRRNHPGQDPNQEFEDAVQEE